MTPDQVILIKMGYWYLLALAFGALWRSIFVAAELKEEKSDYNVLLKFLLISIILLSILQAYQCIDMINNRLGKSWWIPFFCKHGALIFYHISISFVKYKVKNQDDECPESDEDMFSYEQNPTSKNPTGVCHHG